jgi:hypothetical protein
MSLRTSAAALADPRPLALPPADAEHANAEHPDDEVLASDRAPEEN